MRTILLISRHKLNGKSRHKSSSPLRNNHGKKHGLGDNDELLSDSLFSMYVFPHHLCCANLFRNQIVSVSRQQEQSSLVGCSGDTGFGTGSGV